MSNNDLQMLMGGGGNLLLRRRMMMQSKKSGDVPPANQIWYDAESQVSLYTSTNVVSHTFSNGRGIVTFNKNLTGVSSAWFRNTPITAVYLPETIISLDQYAFWDCRKLTYFQFPDKLQSIGNGAFMRSYAIEFSPVPTTVINIDTSAFYFSRATSIVFLNPIPCTLGSQAFDGTTFPIYVPAESVDTYKAASGWSAYASRIFAIPE